MSQTLKIAASPLDAAIDLHKAGQIKEAEAAYRAIIGTSPKSDGALYRLGIICMQSGRLDEALQHLQKAVSLNPAEPEYQNILAATCLNKGDRDTAEKIYRDALAAHPNHSNLHTNYANLLVRTGDTGGAEKHFREALKHNPRNVEAMNNLGQIYYNRNDTGRALPLFEEALAIRPGYGMAWFHYGETLKAFCRYTEAAEAYRRMTEIIPESPAGWVNLATMLVMHNQIDEALSYYRKALTLNPREIGAYLQINYLLQGMSKSGEIPALIEQVKKNLPHTGIAAYIEAQYLRRNRKHAEARDILLPFANGDDVISRKIQYELGTIFDKLDEPAKAFHHCTQGNLMALNTTEAQSLSHTAAFDGIDSYMKSTTAAELKKWTPPVENKNYPDPVFIVGFPRSGTTLLDQILSAHPGIYVSAERESLAPVCKLMRGKVKTLAQRLPHLNADDIESLRNIYFDTHKAYGDWQDRPVFIDKLPLNINILNVVYRLFPKAKIVTALRHPCDCVLSNYMYDFTPNYAMIHTNNIESCARLYAKSMELYERYKEVLPMPFYELRYEDVVRDLRGEAEKILNFLSLPWDESVMEYHKAANEGKFISTPSAGQVTEKIYTSASQRWLKYREQLAPVLPILEPWVKRFGYEM